MSSLDLDASKAYYQIRAFKPGLLQINDVNYTKSLILLPDRLIENWPPQEVTQLTSDSLLPIIDLKPDILLIGTGATHSFLSLEIYGDLINHGIGVEIMDTRAACRTFNALAAENRRVAAALIIR